MHRFNAILTFALLLLLTGLTGVARAQSTPQQLAEANRSAMDAYNNLEVEQAKKTLLDAIQGAERHGLTGTGLARTYANLGVVEIGGFSDSGAGLDAFVRALREDANVEPDPLVSTPEVQQVFLQAKRKAAQGGGARPRTTTPPPAPGVVEGNLEHVPPPEQLVQTAVPVFVQAGDLEVARMKIFYRSLGMRQPKSAEMRQGDDGFSYLIPCEDVFEPNVEYFVVAEDENGTKVGNAGTPQTPVSVPIVTSRSQPAPSLPGETPPTQCGGSGGEEDTSGGVIPSGRDAECPPGMPGCGGTGGLGDTCRADSDCSSDLACVDNFCAMGEREERDDEDDGKAPKVYFDLAFGVGLAYVGDGVQADAAPPATVANDARDAAYGGPGGTTFNPAAADVVVRNAGWACTPVMTPDNGVLLDQCGVAVDKAGFVPVPVLTFALGYFLTPRFALALTGRLQFGHGEGSIGLSPGLRSEIMLSTPKESGFQANLLAGLIFLPIQAQPPSNAGSEGPYASSGAFGIQLGLKLGYRFTRNFGLIVQPAANLMMGSQFLFDVDLTGGIQVAF